MKVLLIDNYDSFTYNLSQILTEEGAEVCVRRNDLFSLEKVGLYDKIVLSPGPGIPDEAGLLKEVIRTYAHTKPMLGVCLGHQAIAEVFGAQLLNLPEVFHGVQTMVCRTEDDYLFDGLPQEIPVGRYHSWVVGNDSWPNELVVTSLSQEGQIMSLRHRTLDLHGLQFHPESILTPDGRAMLRNFLRHDSDHMPL
ncbi:MAG: aminodeoxychorismate/anthranilate synthase component II [Bacteroidaceae bacterium]|nr:aminodeoxychorismate/anthranilate synthase component II [Bacteroidaceae bacterium]